MFFFHFTSRIFTLHCVIYFIGGLGYVTENCVIDAQQARDILSDLKDRKDMVQMTFENNEILDVPGMCAVFKQLRQFEKLESLNFRCNKNFNDQIVAALAEGITLKKELRVSSIFPLCPRRIC